MKKFLITFIIFLSTICFAQQYSKAYLDSLYNQYVQIRTGTTIIQNIAPGRTSTPTKNPVIKSGFGTAVILKHNIDKFSSDQQAILRKILQRPATDTSIVSPKGYFRIHFYKPGNPSTQYQAPTYNVDSLAIAADSSWNFEINYLGFPPPPGDNGAGGDNLHDVYIVNLSNEYGETDFDNEITGTPSSGTWTSYNLINNDFSGFYTTGINAARVTIAHEFHHSVQVGNYIVRFASNGDFLDLFFYEMTSTSMEIFVYTSIPDYVDYLPAYFYNTNISFSDNDGYDLAIWNLFLKDNFDYSIIKRQWELLTSMRALAAINTSLTERSSSFGKELIQFGVWTYYTNYRSKPGQYFPLASKYPLIRSLSTVKVVPPSMTVNVNTTPATNNFITFTSSTSPDTLVALVSNINYQSGIDSSQSTKSFQYTVYDEGTSGPIPISSNYSAKLTVNNTNYWLNADFLNNQLVRADTIVVPQKLVTLDYAFPSPYYYGKNYGTGSQIFIPVSTTNNGNADLNIYTSSLKLVYSGQAQIFSNNGHPVVSWNARSNNNEILASGVYIYVTKTGNNVVKGKLVIFN
jgi:hypothetical protein